MSSVYGVSIVGGVSGSWSFLGIKVSSLLPKILFPRAMNVASSLVFVTYEKKRYVTIPKRETKKVSAIRFMVYLVSKTKLSKLMFFEISREPKKESLFTQVYLSKNLRRKNITAPERKDEPMGFAKDIKFSSFKLTLRRFLKSKTKSVVA